MSRSCCGGGGNRPTPAKPMGAVTLVYVGSNPMLYNIRGRRYPVGPTRRTLHVTPDDVDELMASGQFVRRP